MDEFGLLQEQIEGLNTRLAKKEEESASYAVEVAALKRELRNSASAEHNVLLLQQVST